MHSSKETIGLVYDQDYLIHTQFQHPERKERLERIMAFIKKEGLREHYEMIDPQPAEVDDIALIHDRSYINSIEEACKAEKKFLDMDTYLVPESYRVALLSAGGVLTGLHRVMEKSPRKVFALNRPPGHHAEKNRAMGFCLFNNIAIAAAAARRDYGLKRVAIVDWDVHHGNGTQHSFEDDPGVLFISIHQSPAYPGTGQLNEVGRGSGEGFTVNMPLPPGCGDVEYEHFIKQVVIPILDQYEPELLLVSSGHDAYRQDPLAGMSLTHRGFYNMAEALSDAAERSCAGQMLLCLEGGYHLDGQAGAVMQVLNALGRWDLPITESAPDLQPGRHAQQRLQEVLEVQRRHWNI